MIVLLIGLLFICVGVLQIGACFTTPIAGNPTDGLVLCAIGLTLTLASTVSYLLG